MFAAINGLVFAIVSLGFLDGGGADSGKIEDSHYYLYSRGRQYFEVSSTVWYYSYWHALSVMVTFPLGGVMFALATKVQNS